MYFYAHLWYIYNFYWVLWYFCINWNLEFTEITERKDKYKNLRSQEYALPFLGSNCVLSLPGCPPTRRQCRRVGGCGSEPLQRQFQGTVSSVFHVNNHLCSGSLPIVISEHITWDWTVNTNTTRGFLRKKRIKGDMSVQAHQQVSSRFLKRLWNSVFILRSMACHALCLEMLCAR